MKFLKSFCIILFLGITFICYSQSSKTYFTLDPTLTPDAETIIFSYEGDLWKVPTNGGNAFRITAMQGEESKPSISPNGKWLAFVSNQYGNNECVLILCD